MRAIERRSVREVVAQRERACRQVRGGNSFVRVQTIFQTLQVFIGCTDSNGLLDLGFQGFEVFRDRWMLVFGCLDVAFVGSLDVGL